MRVDTLIYLDERKRETIEYIRSGGDRPELAIEQFIRDFARLAMPATCPEPKTGYYQGYNRGVSDAQQRMYEVIE